MSRRALLFDLDGTLIDSIGLLLECMHHAFDGRTRCPSQQQWIAGIGTPLRKQLAEWADDDAMVESLVERYRQYQDLHLERLTSAYPGIPELLRWARDRGHALGLVTSKGRGMTARSLDHVAFTSLFDVIVTVESTHRHKPDAEPVLFALEQLGVLAPHALFVGDSPHDMFAGRAAGVATVAVLWGPFAREQLAPANPTYWAASAEELRDLIGQWERSNLSGPLPVQSGDQYGTHVRSSGDHATT